MLSFTLWQSSDDKILLIAIVWNSELQFGSESLSTLCVYLKMQIETYSLKQFLSYLDILGYQNNKNLRKKKFMQGAPLMINYVYSKVQLWLTIKEFIDLKLLTCKIKPTISSNNETDVKNKIVSSVFHKMYTQIFWKLETMSNLRTKFVTFFTSNLYCNVNIKFKTLQLLTTKMYSHFLECCIAVGSLFSHLK